MSHDSPSADAMTPIVGEGRFRVRKARAVDAVTASWAEGGLQFDCRRWQCADADTRWTASHHLFVLTDIGTTEMTEIRVEDDCAYSGRDGPGSLSFVPAWAERRCAFRDADLRYAALWIDPALAEDLTGAPCSATPVLNGRDDVAAILLRDLQDLALTQQTIPRAYVEHVTALLLLRLAARASTHPIPGTRRTALNGTALRRVKDYIESHLDQDVSLADLASVAGMPVDRFARRFRAATGLAPYAYVLERRIRRGERLLADDREADIAAIALRLGFSSQSHFTSAFRRRVGTTPASYRNAFVP